MGVALLACFCAGVISSIIAGLFGLGGGMIIVPALVMVFRMMHMSSDVRVHLAMGTSLAVMMLTGATAVYARSRLQKIDWSVLKRLLPGIVLGVSAGVLIASALPGSLLRHLFGVFLLIIALRMFLLIKPKAWRQLPGSKGLSVFGFAVGIKSGLLGVGGGILTVPFLLRHNLSMAQAAALSSCCSVIIAVTGSLGFMLTGWHAGIAIPYSLGYIYWPAFVTVGLASILFAPLGVKLSHHLPTHIAKRGFAVLLFTIGFSMLVS